MIQEERIRRLSEKPVRKGQYLLYWIQASPRVAGNHAFQYAAREADRLSLPLLACFCLIPGYPEASRPQYRFMIEGLLSLSTAMRERGVRLVILKGALGASLPSLAGDAAMVVTDRGYLRFHDEWRREVAGELDCRLVQVETNAIVPVEVASPKEEWSAATFRPKIRRMLDRFLVPLEERTPARTSVDLDVGPDDEETLASLLTGATAALPPAGNSLSPDPLPWRGGEAVASALLDRFIRDNLTTYPESRNDPATGVLSCMSPYLHFGQISPLCIAERVLRSRSPAREPYLEELIARRELAINFVHYNPHYDAFSGLPPWARKTLADHATDPREYLYRFGELESARTHDMAWNAAQREMVLRGKMHGYMRMYWGKKILEWSETPEDAFRTALALNNRYELDGRDPNGYTGVAWCFGKHDRAWKERPVFGKVRYMNAAGLSRKFDTGKYAASIRELADGNGS